ncbi:MAG: hypothetical protein WC595_03795 [Candidatus Nanoarchaeia archaeon]
MIVIRMNHDLQTGDLYAFTVPVIKLAEQKGYTVTILENEEVSETNLRKRIRTRRPSFIFFNGHGSAEALYDAHLKEFINLKSADVFKDTITFTRACDALSKLGREAVKKYGCIAFIGYKKKFFIARANNTTCKPLQDPIIQPILESSNVVANELLKGKTVEEAVFASRKASADQILKLIYSKEPLAVASLQALMYNDMSLDFEGEAESKLR